MKYGFFMYYYLQKLTETEGQPTNVYTISALLNAIYLPVHLLFYCYARKRTKKKHTWAV